jgi:hypothetical protein
MENRNEQGADGKEKDDTKKPEVEVRDYRTPTRRLNIYEKAEQVCMDKYPGIEVFIE